MKILKNISLAVVTTLALAACSSDDDAPMQVNEEELITTVEIALELDNFEVIVFSARDLDGDGPNPPVVDDVTLSENTTYSGFIGFSNETESPAEDITEEVAEEAEEHQIFYQTSAGLNLTTTYTDMDADGNPIGLRFTLETGDASTGTFTVTLRHEPNKGASGVADGNITNAGGETDVTQTFDLTIQ